jgi:hypothetical protein
MCGLPCTPLGCRCATPRVTSAAQLIGFLVGFPCAPLGRQRATLTSDLGPAQLIGSTILFWHPDAPLGCQCTVTLAQLSSLDCTLSFWISMCTGCVPVCYSHERPRLSPAHWISQFSSGFHVHRLDGSVSLSRVTSAQLSFVLRDQTLWK